LRFASFLQKARRAAIIRPPQSRPQILNSQKRPISTDSAVSASIVRDSF
jgi:hypothetical protein